MQASKLNDLAPLNRWPYPVRSTRVDSILLKAIEDPEWVRFRMSIKDLPTGKKLAYLQQYFVSHVTHKVPSIVARDVKLRVDDYINKLRQEGALVDDKGKKNVVVN